MQYLEQKNIINPKRLTDEHEMKSLLGDIMKLDLNKFSKPRKQSSRDSSTNKRKAHPSPAPAKGSNNNQTVKKRMTSETNNSPSNVREETQSGVHPRAEKSPHVLNVKHKNVYQHHH